MKKKNHKCEMKGSQVKCRLSLLDSDLVARIWSINNDRALRLFACECATLALRICGNNDARLFAAVEVSASYAQGIANRLELDEVCGKALEAAVEADGRAFDARNDLEEGKGALSRYLEAFSAARAAFSAKCCCYESVTAAASDAVYEAWTALRTKAESGCSLEGLFSPQMSDVEVNSVIGSHFREILDNLD